MRDVFVNVSQAEALADNRVFARCMEAQDAYFNAYVASTWRELGWSIAAGVLALTVALLHLPWGGLVFVAWYAGFCVVSRYGKRERERMSAMWDRHKTQAEADLRTLGYRADSIAEGH